MTNANKEAFHKASLAAFEKEPGVDDHNRSVGLAWYQLGYKAALSASQPEVSVEGDKPTPLPWRVTEPDEKKTREIVGADGSTVARLTALDMANAHLIVQSVNSAALSAQKEPVSEQERKDAERYRYATENGVVFLNSGSIACVGKHESDTRIDAAISAKEGA